MPAYDPKANRPRPIESDGTAVIDSLLPPEPGPAPVVEAPAVEASSNLIRNAVIAAAVLGLVVTAVAASKRGR